MKRQLGRDGHRGLFLQGISCRDARRSPLLPRRQTASGGRAHGLVPPSPENEAGFYAPGKPDAVSHKCSGNGGGPRITGRLRFHLSGERFSEATFHFQEKLGKKPPGRLDKPDRCIYDKKESIIKPVQKRRPRFYSKDCVPRLCAWRGSGDGEALYTAFCAAVFE